MRKPHQGIVVGLVIGASAGLLVNLLTAPGAPAAAGREAVGDVVRELIEPLGKAFLRLLFLTVLPLVFSSLVLGIRELGNPRDLGRIGIKTLVFTLLLSGISVALGLTLVNIVRPGTRLSEESREALLLMVPKQDADKVRAAAEEAAGPESPSPQEGIQGDRVPRLERIVTTMIPRNPVEAAARAFDGDMLAVMFFALLFGIAMGTSSSARMGTLVAFMQGLYDVSLWLVGFAMRIAPVGVAALVFSVASRVGLDILLILAAYMATVLTGLAIHQLVVYSLVLRFACGLSPILFFRRVRPVMVTAFSTSSSNATLPTTIETARTRLGIPGKVANFVLTLGSTFNQNGTALFEGVSVIFIAQAYGVPLGMDQQLLVLGMAILAGVGTAGVPGGSIPMIVPVLVGIGVPAEGIFIILGVDRLLDMCRTVLNVTGDMVAAAFIARSEGALEVPPE